VAERPVAHDKRQIIIFRFIFGVDEHLYNAAYKPIKIVNVIPDINLIQI
jgi:hypothetical protein